MLNNKEVLSQGVANEQQSQSSFGSDRQPLRDFAQDVVKLFEPGGFASGKSEDAISKEISTMFKKMEGKIDDEEFERLTKSFEILSCKSSPFRESSESFKNKLKDIFWQERLYEIKTMFKEVNRKNSPILEQINKAEPSISDSLQKNFDGRKSNPKNRSAKDNVGSSAPVDPLSSVDSFKPRVLLMANLVPHVLDAIIKNSTDQQKSKYEELQKEKGAIQKAILDSRSAEQLEVETLLKTDKLFHLNDGQKESLVQTLEICQEICDPSCTLSEEESLAEQLVGSQQYIQLADYSSEYLIGLEAAKGQPNANTRAIQSAESGLAKSVIKSGLDDKTLGAALDNLFKDPQKGYYRSDENCKKVARVASNVPYVIEALGKKGSRVSDLNVGQIQLAAMFLDNFKSNASKQYSNAQNNNIEEFEKFARANRLKYGFDDKEIKELTSAMEEFQNARNKGPDELQGKPLAQALYVSHQLDLLRDQWREGYNDIADKVEKKY